MKVDRLVVPAFCNTCPPSVSFKIDQPLNKDILPLLAKEGFVERPNFTKSNILYVESVSLIVSGMFGQNTIQTRCKIRDCQNFVNDFEQLLTKF